MKTTIVKILLLLSLSFNIVHATFIAAADDRAGCRHTTAVDFVLDQHDDENCGDLCKLHHYFHFVAILDAVVPALQAPSFSHTPQTAPKTYIPPYNSAAFKPPKYA